MGMHTTDGESGAGSLHDDPGGAGEVPVAESGSAGQMGAEAEDLRKASTGAKEAPPPPGKAAAAVKTKTGPKTPKAETVHTKRWDLYRLRWSRPSPSPPPRAA